MAFPLSFGNDDDKYEPIIQFTGMIFELLHLNTITMKKIAFLFIIGFIFSGCSSTQELTGTRAESRKLEKLANQADIKNAIESRKYIITANRIYTPDGRIMDLVPRSNFVIVNGEIASVSLGYIGRSYFSRPISGINLNSYTSVYKMENNEVKGLYKIEMELEYASDKFDVYLTIGKEGSCDISISNPNIQPVHYSGNLVPLPAPSSNIILSVNK
jgi:hypothetical protein